MNYHLTIQWPSNPTINHLQATLYSFSEKTATSPLTGTIAAEKLRFESLKEGNYLLSLQHQHQGQAYDSFYFHLHIPDITLIKLTLEPAGAQIDQMGFLNDYGEFVDMLFYEGEKPFLTQSAQKHKNRLAISKYLAFEHASQSAAQAAQTLNTLIGDLALAYETLCQLWPYQLKFLLQPPLLVHTTAEWKACLMQLLRNDLVLMDNEKLYENLSEAMDFTQQEERVGELLNLMDWDADTEDWFNKPQFLKEISNKTMLVK